jgi:hypothetical protein
MAGRIAAPERVGAVSKITGIHVEGDNMARIIQGVLSNALALVAGPLTASGHAALGVALVAAATALAVTISHNKQ